MATRLQGLAKTVGAVLGERKKLEKVERKLVATLNKALRKIGYSVVPAKGVTAEARRRRPTRRAKPARRPRRRTVARRRRARAKK